MRQNYRRQVDTAVDSIDRSMLRALGTDTPAREEVKRVALREGLLMEPVYGDRAFAAELIMLGDLMYVIRYNATQLPILQALQIYHEICEYKAIQIYPGLFDDDNTVTAHHYDGGQIPYELRHIVAVECERRQIRRYSDAGYPVPKSARRPGSHTPRVYKTRTHQSGCCHCGCANSGQIVFPDLTV